MPSLQELLAQRSALDTQRTTLEEQIAEARKRERADKIAKVEALMLEAGLTVSDLSSRVHGPRRAARQPPVNKASASRSDGKVAAKYRHPATGETWSGRGLQPRWLKSALASGAKLEDFAL